MDKPYFIGPERRPDFPRESSLFVSCYFANPDGGPVEHRPEYSFTAGVLSYSPNESKVTVQLDERPSGYHNVASHFRKLDLDDWQRPVIEEVDDPVSGDRRKVVVQYVLRAVMSSGKTEMHFQQIDDQKQPPLE